MFAGKNFELCVMLKSNHVNSAAYSPLIISSQPFHGIVTTKVKV